ncbi:UNVERIFIED_CONTAM: hypothetical protein K2H54_044451 [Gekko kuhli]
MFTMVLEPIEGGDCVQRDDSGPSDSTPEDAAEQLPDTDATNHGSPKDSGPSTSTPDDGEGLSNSGEKDTDDVDPGAIISEMTPAERLNSIRARQKRVTTVQKVGEQFLKAATSEQAVYLEAAKWQHDELMQEMRAS